jgi:hypothetical protein
VVFCMLFNNASSSETAQHRMMQWQIGKNLEATDNDLENIVACLLGNATVISELWVW